MTRFATLIRKRRLSMGLTQEEVSDMLSVGRPQYANIETRDRMPSVRTAIEIARCLKIKDAVWAKALRLDVMEGKAND